MKFPGSQGTARKFHLFFEGKAPLDRPHLMRRPLRGLRATTDEGGTTKGQPIACGVPLGIPIPWPKHSQHAPAFSLPLARGFPEIRPRRGRTLKAHSLRCITHSLTQINDRIIWLNQKRGSTRGFPPRRNLAFINECVALGETPRTPKTGASYNGYILSRCRQAQPEKRI